MQFPIFIKANIHNIIKKKECHSRTIYTEVSQLAGEISLFDLFLIFPMLICEDSYNKKSNIILYMANIVSIFYSDTTSPISKL